MARLTSPPSLTVIFTPVFNDDIELNREIFASEITVPGVSDGGAHTKFVTIGRYSTDNARVSTTVLDTLAGVARAAVDAGARERLGVIRETAETIAGPAREDARTERDRALVDEALERVRRACRAT